MKFTRYAAGTVIAAALAAAGPAPAEVQTAMVDLDRVDACLAEDPAAAEPPARCVIAAQDACLDAAVETPAVATLCFERAAGTWSGGIAALMKEIKAGAAPDSAAIAGIEVKYDLLSGLVQCDRMEELALAVSSEPEEAVLLDKTRCRAAASGLAYLRLKWRAKGLK